MYYLEVSVAAAFTGRRFYTYQSPTNYPIGSIVSVPFGKKNVIGIVRAIVKKPTFATKQISLDTGLQLSAASISLLRWMESFYPYDYGDISQLFIPPNCTTRSRTHEQDAVIESMTSAQPNLTKDQQNAIRLIDTQRHILLHGDTGTGKTRVFLEIANSALKNNKSVLILTPEIGLTPQLQQTVQATCPYPVHIIHSQKTAAYRKRIWQQAAANDQPAIYIGPRSSLFLPYHSIGLIVADEAHDNSYKSMQNPRYHGLHVAAQLAKIHNATFIQSTATPNVTDYATIVAKHITVVRMTTIAAGNLPSKGVVVDMTDKKQFKQHPLLSDTLIATSSAALARNEQVMLFINRRGSARIIQCEACGHIESCPNCGLPITYHHDTHQISCHLCNYSTAAINQCSACQSTDLRYTSPGTKGIEQEIQKLFPKARIARFDLDAKAKDSIQRNLQQLQSGEFNIIIGTQGITKGFDLPNLSVVGVINADNGFALPDYRAEELTFQQLYQVTGRVGRGHNTNSSYIIQTHQPQHPVIQAALARNWQTFYTYEHHKRQQFTYPPYTHLALATVTKAKQSTAQKTAQRAYDQLSATGHVTVLGPSPSYHETAHKGYTWQLLIKSHSRAAIVQALLLLPNEWTIDMEPTSVL